MDIVNDDRFQLFLEMCEEYDSDSLFADNLLTDEFTINELAEFAYEMAMES